MASGRHAASFNEREHLRSALGDLAQAGRALCGIGVRVPSVSRTNAERALSFNAGWKQADAAQLRVEERARDGVGVWRGERVALGNDPHQLLRHAGESADCGRYA